MNGKVESRERRVESQAAGTGTTPSTLNHQPSLTHPCPVENCRIQHVPNDRLLCAPHWARVPKRAQNDVWKAWATLQNATKSKLPLRERVIHNRAYVVARGKAIAWAEREPVPE